jgi:8-oxo-dGTP pyrophosphatase MutT (NUDIX family)
MMPEEILIHPVTGEAMPPAMPAATLVIFKNNPDGDAPLILMMERVQSMAFAAGAIVFPGGKVDDQDRAFAGRIDHGLDPDEAAARIAVIRETIEEAGLALALDGPSDPTDCVSIRAALHEGVHFAELCRQYGWTLQLDQLIPWARWRPPNLESRVFDTRFYLIDAGDAPLSAVADKTENKALFWDTASGVLNRLNRGEAKAIFPTVRNLERLAQFGSFASTAAHAALYPVKLLLTYVEDREGVPHLCVPDGYGYPVTAEAMTSARRG